MFFLHARFLDIFKKKPKNVSVWFNKNNMFQAFLVAFFVFSVFFILVLFLKFL